MRGILLTVTGLILVTSLPAAGNPVIDYTQSYIVVQDDGYGIASCPDGDGPAFQYVAAVLYDYLTDTYISGVHPWAIVWDYDDAEGAITFTAVDDTSDANGLLRYELTGDETLCYGSSYWEAQIELVSVHNQDVGATDYVYATSFDLDCDGDVDPADFVLFSQDYGTYHERSDFDFDGDVDPVDFVAFSDHYGHP